jgi:hypothetical protein
MDALEIFGRLIVGISSFAVVAYLWGLFSDWLSKTTNGNVSYRGEIISRPDQHDKNMADIKEAKDKVISNSKLLVDKIKSLSEKRMSTAEKIQALKDLEELKKQKTITDEQYQNYKSKLL